MVRDAAQGAEVNKGVQCSVASVLSASLRPYGLKPARLLCPWDHLGKNTGMGCPGLLQRIFRTQGSNLCLRSTALASGSFTTSANWENPTRCNIRQTVVKGSFSSDYQVNSEVTPRSCSVLKQGACSHVSYPSIIG